MSNLTVNVTGRVQGRWRMKVAAWLLSGVKGYYRVGHGEWDRLPLQIEIVVSQREGDADGAEVTI
jgi:hypothetical protein